MNMIHETTKGGSRRAGLGNAASWDTGAGGMVFNEEIMPFTVKIVRTQAELAKAVQIRHAAYARHVPELAKLLREAEAYDYEEGSAVLLAESKLDGAPLGTMRIQTNLHRSLPLEGSVELPDWLRGRSLAEATRLGVKEGGIGRVVKVMLYKAFFMYCLGEEVNWMVVAGRTPVDRQYESLLFSDVFPGKGYIPLRHIGNIPHRVLAFEPSSAEKKRAEAKHPLFDFIFRTRHPDIDLTDPAKDSLPSRRRADNFVDSAEACV
jgi:hypothetical protein